MTNCLFCKIINKEIPATIFAETQHCIAFLDIHPVHPGHSLIVPKPHIATFLEANEGLVTDWICLAQRVAELLTKELDMPGFNLIQNNGAAAGQVVPHLHLHVIPRLVEDGLQHWPGKEADQTELATLAKRLGMK